MNIIPAKNNVHFGIMFIFKNSEQNTVTSVFIVLPGILLFCSLILSYHNSFFHNQKIFFREMNKKMNIILLSKLIYFNVFLLSYFWIFLSVIRNFEWFLGLILSYFYLALLYSILSNAPTQFISITHTNNFLLECHN